MPFPRKLVRSETQTTSYQNWAKKKSLIIKAWALLKAFFFRLVLTISLNAFTCFDQFKSLKIYDDPDLKNTKEKYQKYKPQKYSI